MERKSMFDVVADKATDADFAASCRRVAHEWFDKPCNDGTRSHDWERVEIEDAPVVEPGIVEARRMAALRHE